MNEFLLDAAVNCVCFHPVCLQCEKKETFIQQIQSLDIQTQAAIAGHIQQVLLSINQMEHQLSPPKAIRQVTGNTRRYYPAQTLLRGFFVPKYDLARHFFSVWPGDRRSEAIIPSTGASSECENELLVILLAAFKGPLGAPRCHRRMDLPPLMSDSPPPPFSHHPLFSSFPPLRPRRFPLQ